jgi:hypothetical protein
MYTRYTVYSTTFSHCFNLLIITTGIITIIPSQNTLVMFVGVVNPEAVRHAECHITLVTHKDRLLALVADSILYPWVAGDTVPLWVFPLRSWLS